MTLQTLWIWRSISWAGRRDGLEHVGLAGEGFDREHVGARRLPGRSAEQERVRIQHDFEVMVAEVSAPLGYVAGEGSLAQAQEDPRWQRRPPRRFSGRDLDAVPAESLGHQRVTGRLLLARELVAER
jgi:hypothetical protein